MRPWNIFFRRYPWALLNPLRAPLHAGQELGEIIEINRKHTEKPDRQTRTQMYTHTTDTDTRHCIDTHLSIYSHVFAWRGSSRSEAGWANSRDFSGEIFLERNTAREQVSRAVILENF